MEKDDFQESEDKKELVDLADISGLTNYRPTAKSEPDEIDSDEDDSDFNFFKDPIPSEIFDTRIESTRPRGRPPRPGNGKNTGLAVGGGNRDKPLFPSSIAADILHLHPRTLRIYEELGLVVPYRTETQRRRYSPNDISKTRFIQFLTQGKRVNLEGVRIILEMLDGMRQLGVADPVRKVFSDYQEPD